MNRVIGILVLALVGGGLFGMVANAVGVKETVKAFAFAIGVTALIYVGIALIAFEG